MCTCAKCWCTPHGRSQILVRADYFLGRPLGDSGAKPPGPETFRKFSKNFLRKLLKMHYSSIFFKRLNKPCVDILRVWRKKHKVWKIFRKFWNFLIKLQKKNEFLTIFGTFLTKNRAFENNHLSTTVFPISGDFLLPPGYALIRPLWVVSSPRKFVYR